MSEEPAKPPPPSSSFIPLLAGCLGAIAALLIVGVYFAWQTRSPWPEVTADDLAAAQQRWQAAKEPSYRSKLKLIGRLGGDIELTVRDGEPTGLIRDGEEVKQPRTWSSWTVEGLIQLIRIDLDSLAIEGRQSLYLSGEFDPKIGLPRHYRRVQFDPPVEAGWDVVEWTTEPD